MFADRATISVGGSELRYGRHVCAFFDSDEERYRMLLPFIKEGIAEGERAVHIVGDDEQCSHVDRLSGAGIDVGAAQARGQLAVLSSAETYLQHGCFDQDRMVKAFEEIAGRCPSDVATRFVCHMGWVAKRRPSWIDDVIEFESRVNSLWETRPDIVICAYDLRTLTADAIVSVMQTHPMVLLGGMLHQNPFYLTPAEFFSEKRLRKRGTPRGGSGGARYAPAD